MYSNQNISKHEDSYEIIRIINKKLNATSEKRVFKTACLQGNIVVKLALYLYKHCRLVILCLFTVLSLVSYVTHSVNTISSNLFIERWVFELANNVILAIFLYSLLAANIMFMIAESQFKDFKIIPNCRLIE